jgi:hypothetical protein
MRLLKAGLLALVCVAALCFALSSKIKAHSWYGAECCSDRDCAPVPVEAVKETPEGFYVLPQGDFVERGKEKPSLDGEYHVCRYPSGRLICLYVPPRGS